MKPELKFNVGKAYYADTASPENLNGILSKSMLWRFAQSPFKWRYGPKQKVSSAMDFGSLVHDLTFQPDLGDQYAVNTEFKDFRTKAAQEWRDNAIAEGKTVVTQKDMEMAEEMSELVRRQIDSMLGNSDYEVAVYGQIGGASVKGMIDILPHDVPVLADLKTIDSIKSEKHLQSVIWDRGYNWQAALYLDLYNEATGEKRENMRFVFIETERPFDVAWVDLDEDLIQRGRVGYMNAIAKYQKCLATREWHPTIPQILTRISAPKWATNE